MLSNGEYVFNADAVRKFGVGYLDMMNSGNVPHRKHGGILGSLLPFVLGAIPGLLLHTGPFGVLGGAALAGGLFNLGEKAHGPFGDILKFLGSPALFAAEELFGKHGGKGGPTLSGTPKISIPNAANSNTPGGDTYNIHVLAPNTGDPVKDRQTSLQQAADIRYAVAGASRKGLMG
jgi:hypothetical protein